MRLDTLAHQLRWVAWRIELRGEPPRPAKVPYSPTGKKAKADDPSTWGTRVAAEVCAARLANGAGGGIGFQLGDLGNGMFVAGLDLDSCLAPDGTSAHWANAILVAVPSYAERSPSGRGIKIFFCVRRETVRPFLNRIGVLSDHWGTRRGIPGEDDRDHGPAIEIYFARRYFTVTDDRWSGAPLELATLDTTQLDRLAALIPSQKASETRRNAGADTSRSARAFRKGLEMRRAGASFEEFCEVLRTDPETASWYSDKGIPNGGREIARIWAKAERPASDAAEIARLAALPPLQYEREREAAAKRLGCRTAILDRLVGSTREASVPAGQGRPLDLHHPEPWPDPVDGATLLDAMAAAIRRHVVVGAAETDAVALRALAVHAFDAFSIFPRLFITAPEKGCGKSTLLDLLSRLVPRPLGASSITAAALFRTIEAARPTLLLDEADAYARDNEELRSVLDGGHSRKGFVIRCVGEDNEPRRFSVWAPVALAAIGHLPGTVEDRSIKVAMRRRRPDEFLEQLRDGRAQHLEKMARMASRWAADHAGALAEADPVMPAGTINRAADNWRPLLAVADMAGGAWPERARRAVIELSDDSEDAMSSGVLLLADLRELFTKQPSGVLFTREILKALHADETRPWPEWKSGRPITDRQLASLLKPYKIKPKTVRRGTETDKGYKLDWFADAFASYLPPRSVTASQASIHAVFDGHPSVTKPAAGTQNVTDHRSQKSSVSASCDGVTFPEAGSDNAEFGERAGILEYDGGYPRDEAERLVRAEGRAGGPCSAPVVAP
jgi:Protein of unknown function (DUF3631)